MGVIMQAFYWDCPRLENCEHGWWNFVAARVPALRRAGFTALWLPPLSKAASVKSMGYDPYDYHDLGEFAQKGGAATWFGTRAELQALIHTAHAHELQVYADLVFNHNSGADAQERNPLDGQLHWTRFQPRSAKFPRGWDCFHPSPYEMWDKETFAGMPDLCHRNPAVYTELISYSRWLLEEIGCDGFRYDCVKGYGGWMVRSIQELRALRDGKSIKPFGVGECWDSDRTIQEWLDETNAWSDNPAAAFDFPLRWRLRELCDTYGFSLRQLAAPGTLFRERPFEAVTFVENHDVARDTPVIRDKLLAYAFILTHEGYPCVFWQDYFNFNLAHPGTPYGIDALILAHERHAGGTTQVLHAEDDLYIMQRLGLNGQSGLVFVLNNRGSWNGARVRTAWARSRFQPVAWHGHDDAQPRDQRADETGSADLWAAPRGYAVYVPQSG